MLTIVIPETEAFDPKSGEFVTIKRTTLVLEHSLVSLSKWESNWEKPFLKSIKDGKLNNDELIDYIKCMTVTQNVNSDAYKCLTQSNINEIINYIKKPMTATWFSADKNKKTSSKVVTSELIYYWMFALNIPIECQKWHLNRLLTLIKVCNIENTPKKKMPKQEALRSQAELNAARRKALHTNG